MFKKIIWVSGAMSLAVNGAFAETGTTAPAKTAAKPAQIKTPGLDSSKMDSTQKTNATTQPKTDASKTGAAQPSDTTPATQPSGTAPKPAPAKVPGLQMGETHKETTRPEDDGYGKTHGVLGPVPIGPSVTLLGAAQLFQIALQGKYKDYASFQAGYGFVPELTISSVKAKLHAFDGRVRWHPFRGAFFLGFGYGSQTVTASITKTISAAGLSQAVKVTGEMDSKYVLPHLGWRWVWKSGFFMGMDLGWQANSGSTIKLSTDAPAALLTTTEYLNAEADVRKKATDYGNKGIPNLTILQLGFLF